MTRLIVIAIILLLSGPAWGATYHYVNPELTTGTADGSSWANAWKTFATVAWTTLATEAETQPVYLYVKKGSISREYLYPGTWNGGSSDTNRVYITTDPTDTGALRLGRTVRGIRGAGILEASDKLTGVKLWL